MDIQKIREDFPILQKPVAGKPIIYFDNACVTLRPKKVIAAVYYYYTRFSACAGRSSHKLGRKVTEEVEETRKAVAKFIGAKKSEEIVFVKNTTEALNLVANSLGLQRGDVVLTTDREHNSNLLPWQILSEKIGIEHRIVPSKEDNSFDMEKFKELVKGVKLVSMVHTSNLDGYTIPAKEIIKIAHENKALVMLDAAQSVPHKEISVKDLDVDFLCFSGHKMIGPSGIGVLYGKYKLLEQLSPFIIGGDTVERTTYKDYILMKPPRKFEAGLQNYAGIFGLKEAVEYLQKVGRKNIEQHEIELNRFVTAELSQFENIEIIGPKDPTQRGGIFSFNIKGMDSHDVALLLDESANIMVRSGQHCVHSWFASRGINSSIRASFYLYNTKEEAQIFVEKIKDILKLNLP